MLIKIFNEITDNYPTTSQQQQQQQHGQNS